MSVSDLVPAGHDARRHDESRDIPVLAKSLRRFSQRKPIVARRESKEVNAGNGTLLATQRLWRAQVAVAWFDGSDEAARAYALADNRPAELSVSSFEELAAQGRGRAHVGSTLPPSAASQPACCVASITFAGQQIQLSPRTCLRRHSRRRAAERLGVLPLRLGVYSGAYTQWEHGRAPDLCAEVRWYVDLDRRARCR